MYAVCRIRIWNIRKLLCVSNILYKCGKNMADLYDLHHWDNSHIKSWVIVFLCAIKNQIYLVYDNNTSIATFQTRKTGQSYIFQKLAVLPEVAGKGIGTFCIYEIERLAKGECCNEVLCEVYDKSRYAEEFYKHRGYIVYGETCTMKYREFKMRKELEK